MTLEENILCSLLSKTVYQATNKASLSIITAPRIYQAEIISSDVNENCLKVDDVINDKAVSVTFDFHRSA